MNLNDAFPSKYLKASDLRGGSVRVTINHVTTEEVGQKKDRKLVVYFAGKDKGFVLNKTNATKIASLTGTMETDEWAGFAITLFATETEFQGDTVETIRVKSGGPVSKTPPVKVNAAPPVEHDVHSEPVYDDDIPFMWVLPFILPALLAVHGVLA